MQKATKNPLSVVRKVLGSCTNKSPPHPAISANWLQHINKKAKNNICFIYIKHMNIINSADIEVKKVQTYKTGEKNCENLTKKER